MNTIPRPPPCAIPAANVSQVPQRSPLRYPGGKTWAIPHIRHWLAALPQPVRLAEPFAGGATASLTAVMEHPDAHAIMADLDPHIAAFWQAALHHHQDLIRLIKSFHPTRENVRALRDSRPHHIAEQGFRTLVINRFSRAGILTPEASLLRSGETGHGLASRWYPQTLCHRIAAIAAQAHRIEFRHLDGRRLIQSLPPETAIFADPPYPTAGKRLYQHSDAPPAEVLELLAHRHNPFLMTAEWRENIIRSAAVHGCQCLSVKMKTAHHRETPELLVARPPVLPTAPP